MRNSSQASQIEAALARSHTQVIAVTGGKGGVGKTSVAANLSVALAAKGRDVMLLDADLGLANVDVMLGLQPAYNLSHVVTGQVDVDSISVDGPCGIRVVPATSGDVEMIDLPATSQAAIVRAFTDLAVPPDTLVIDTAAGIGESVARFTQAAQYALLVVCDEPASLTDAYALVKVFSREYGISHFHIITNMTRNAAHGRKLFTKLSRVADQYLDVVLRHAGNIPSDSDLVRAVQEQRAVAEAYPRSWSAQAFRDLAGTVAALGPRPESRGGIEFFLERALMKSPKTAGDSA